MVGAFFGNTVDAKDIFGKLKISSPDMEQRLEGSGCGSYKDYLNQYNVIYIDFSVEPRECSSYRQYIDRIQDGINSDLAEAYPEAAIDKRHAVWDMKTINYSNTLKKN